MGIQLRLTTTYDCVYAAVERPLLRFAARFLCCVRTQGRRSAAYKCASMAVIRATLLESASEPLRAITARNECYDAWLCTDD